MDAIRYDIQELIQASGVPRRTIHFYVQQGILPPPEGAGLAARYSEEHLARLRLIPILRQQGLRLDDIRARFASMDAEALREAIEKTQTDVDRQNQLFSASSRLTQNPPGESPTELREPRELQTFSKGSAQWQAELHGDHYLHYSLPAGMRLIIPEQLTISNRQRVNMLLQAAQQIFSGGGFYTVDSSEAPEEPKPEED